jgi:hypothetical protein
MPARRENQMRQLLNPELSVRYLSDEMKILVFKAATGEEIGCEVDEATAAEWAAKITAPRAERA